MKTCRACNQIKEYSSFFKDNGLKDGYSNTCKACKIQKTYAWRAKNKNKYNEYMRQRNKDRYPEARLERYGVTKSWYAATLQA